MTFAAALFLLLLAAQPGRAEEGRDGALVCLGGIATQNALVSGQARRLSEIRPQLSGEIVRTDLCRDRDHLVYRVMVLDDRGRVRPVLVDAVSGVVVYDRR